MNDSENTAAQSAATKAVEIKRLVYRRGQLKATLTRFNNFVNSQNLNISVLKVRKANLDTAWAEFEAIQTKLEELDTSQEPERILFEDEYFNAAALANDLIEQHDRDVHSNLNTSIPASLPSSVPNSSNSAKLQSISLPHFSGTYENWLPFFEIFQALVDKNSELTKIQKFYYLQSCLQGEAAQVLHSLEICESNYNEAIKLLRERYENKRVLIHSHVRNLFEMPSITKESYPNLRKLIDNVVRNLRALTSLQQPVDHWDTLLIYLIAQKLDNNTRKEWEIFNKQDSPTFEDFISFLKNKCQVLETIDNKNQSVYEKNTHERNPQNRGTSVPNRGVVAHVNANIPLNQGQEQPLQFYDVGNCSFCHETSHYTYKCPKLLALPFKSRFFELKRLGICTNCLKTGHSANECTSKTCKVCNRKHNSILHDYNYNSNRNPPNRNSDNNTNRNPQNNNTFAAVTLMNDGNTANLQIPASNNFLEVHRNCENETTDIRAQPGNRADKGSLRNAPSEVGEMQTAPYSTATASAASQGENDEQILLATAYVNILDSNGRTVKCRALLDSASQSNFCSEELCNKLNLPRNKINMPVIGINNASCRVSSKIKTTIRSLNDAFQAKIEFLVISQIITTKLPQVSFDPTLINMPANITLADPNFFNSEPIDILIGTEIFFRCLSSEKILFGDNAPILQNTKFSWVLVGPLDLHKVTTNHRTNNANTNCFLTLNQERDKMLHNNVQQFWQIENIENKQNKLSNEELECEKHFRENYKIDSDGRFIVKLPLKENYLALGDSYSIAVNCLLSLERRLAKNPDLQQQYADFLNEYKQLGHMSKINPELDQPGKVCVYLSHHAVVKESSSTTKVRVVFNASLKTDSGLSLNDVLKVGPKVQRDVFDVVLRMRTYPILIVADIEKMYRMILIDESQRSLQRILWRDNETKEIIHYQLNTVTYGTATASFLATRALHEIGLKIKDSNPEISQIIINNFYMDDLIFGHHDLDKAIDLKIKINKILSKFGFNLRKWISNDHRVLEISGDTPNEDFCIPGEGETKTLGTVWNPSMDTIGYNYNIKIDTFKITKRTVLAAIGQLFDILGLISPVIVKAKLILQKIWISKVNWDTDVPEDISIEWLDFVSKLPNLKSLQIPRCVLKGQSFKKPKRLYGFSDASQLAYGACIYLVSENGDEIESHLICAKSRLAPLTSSSMSLPRLELCGALLLARLLEKTIKALEFPVNDTVLFTDSTIVLDWLNAEPSQWKTFICNRVAEIQRLTSDITWSHINTEINPADIVSRGADPLELKNQALWWYGPSFLKTAPETWPDTKKIKISISDVRKENIEVSFAAVKSVLENEIFSRWSSYPKLIRIVAYIYRFFHNLKSNSKLTGILTFQELDEALLTLCRIIQSERFSEEIKALKNNKILSKNSKLISLDPFIDNKGILRVGGRLKNSDLKYDRKHPILLPAKHCFVDLIINYYHVIFLHAGPQFVLNQIRDKFWIVNGRNEVRKIVRKCLICFRVKPVDINQLMGSLPKPRVVPSRPFYYCGVDYAGPYLLKDGKTRNRVKIKAYVCIFICLSTRAVHAELVTDLSTEGFLNAFKRFVSRRGLCGHVFSDNATNFVGSNNELLKLCQVVRDSVNEKYPNYFSEHRITWHFIPPKSPHHGGTWESAVRSFKHHLKRVLGDNHLNFENFYTLLTQIEAILNSRPILPLTNDLSDLEALTPGHFLIGESLIAVPQSNDIDIPANRLRHFKHLQQLVQRFWSLWSKDYLNSLQQRSKWQTRQENVKEGILVLLKEDNEPPMRWPLGRIVSVHPGSDNLVRVVSVRTKNGIFKRAITKVVPLPIEYD